MNFDPEIHTKEYLLNNKQELKQLCYTSPPFARSELAGDFDILSARVTDSNWCVAHILANNMAMSLWLDNPGSTNPDVLALKTDNGFCVAHYLAKNQPNWARSPQARNPDILQLSSADGTTVVEYLLGSYSASTAWIQSLSVNDMAIFSMPYKAYSKVHTIAEYIAQNRPKHLSTDLLNSREFLSLPVGSGGFIAHTLASFHDTWFEQPICKDTNILKLADDDGFSTAHILASTCSKWGMKAESIPDEVLKLTDKNGLSVTHSLVRHLRDSSPKKIWHRQYLKLCTNADGQDHLGLAVAHDLAKYCEDWVNEAPEAFSKEFLTLPFIQRIPATKDLRTIYLFENMKGLSTVDIAKRMLNVGVALKYSKPTECSVVEAAAISEYGQGLVENETDPKIRVKLSAGLYSTLVNLHDSAKNHYNFTNDHSAAWLDEIYKAENTLRAEVASITDLINKLTQFTDLNCEPSDGVLLKICNERELSTVLIKSSADELAATTTMTLY